MRDPKRYRNWSDPKVPPLGGPSPHLRRDERKAFNAYLNECSWLKESDRTLVDIASKLRAKMWKDEASDAAIGALIKCFNLMGLTPVQRHRFATASEADDFDDTARFFKH
jgi:hypothetical protein